MLIQLLPLEFERKHINEVMRIRERGGGKISDKSLWKAKININQAPLRHKMNKFGSSMNIWIFLRGLPKQSISHSSSVLDNCIATRWSVIEANQLIGCIIIQFYDFKKQITKEVRIRLGEEAYGYNLEDQNNFTNRPLAKFVSFPHHIRLSHDGVPNIQWKGSGCTRAPIKASHEGSFSYTPTFFLRSADTSIGHKHSYRTCVSHGHNSLWARVEHAKSMCKCLSSIYFRGHIMDNLEHLGNTLGTHYEVQMQFSKT